MSDVIRNLDIEYSPSLNTKRFQNHEKPHEEVIKHFVETTINDTLVACKKYIIKRDVRYGGHNDNQLMDIYYKENEKNTPIFVFIHGGYWQALEKNTAGPFIEPLVEKGYRVIAVDYNLCPQVTLLELVAQIQNFYAWLLSYARQTQANEIYICGHSAGAHLAITFFKNNLYSLPSAKLIRGFYLISGVYNLKELWSLDCANPQNVMGLTAEIAESLSPLSWSLQNELLYFINQHNIKMHVLVAEYDSETFVEQSSELFEKLKKLQWEPDNLKLNILKGYDHFDIVENMSLNGSDINKYILETLINCNKQ